MRKKVTVYTLVAAALVFIVIGIAQGDYQDTLHKAVVLCLECIGIG